MSFIQWGSALEIGNQDIDGQHKQLVKMVNDLHDAMAAGHGKEALAKLLGNLVNYTVSHFAMEERLMKAHVYPQKDRHVAEHEDLKKTVARLQAEFAAGRTMLTIEVLRFLKEWLAKHILVTDKALGDFLATKAAR